MRSRSEGSPSRTLITAASLLFFSGAALGASYTVSVIPPPGGFTQVGMSGINNSGQVAGYGYNGTVTLAFIAGPSGSTVIPTPPAWSMAAAAAINNAGQVTGGVSQGGFPGPGQAFVGTAAGVTLLPLPAGWTYASGAAINDSGQVAGSLFTTGFIGNASGSTVIAPPSGWGTAAAYAINASGQVTGGGATGNGFQAFIGTASGAVPIPLPTGWSPSSPSNIVVYGFAINDSGQVAGTAFGPLRAFIGNASGTTLIPLPAGATTARTNPPNSLNNSGVVVGQSDAGGWIWSSSTGTQLLNAMAPSGWNISNAIGISQNGLILAQGAFNGGAVQFVELAPTAPLTPAPGAGLLVVTGLLLVLAWRNRLRSLWLRR